jgi:hypothetical protein
MRTPSKLQIEKRETDIGPAMKTDYWRDLAMTEPDQPGGRIVFSTADYETQEEEDAAFEAFIAKHLGDA